jgi:hypothetical protein
MTGLRSPAARVRPRTALALAGALAALAGGCGHTTTVGSSRTLSIAVTEYRLAPETVRMTQGAVTLVVHNLGLYSHNLSISLNGVSEGTTDPIPPGQTAVLTVALSPGRYVIASTLQQDESLGAYGTLIVTR